MKFNRMFVFVFVFALAYGLNLQAQTKEMTVEEWQNEMNKNRARVESLQKEVETLNSDISNLNNQLSKMQSFEDCMDDAYALVGAKKSEVDNFRKAVNELEGRIRRKEGPKADRQADLDALKANKISALPEFYDRVHNQMQKMLNDWVDVVKEVVVDNQYTVVKGDCLWYIARKKEFYGNGFAWPKIYQANRSSIKNPDLIYPKQTFTIPALTADEKDKYEKLRMNYKPAPVQ